MFEQVRKCGHNSWTATTICCRGSLRVRRGLDNTMLAAVNETAYRGDGGTTAWLSYKAPKYLRGSAAR